MTPGHVAGHHVGSTAVPSTSGAVAAAGNVAVTTT